MGEAGYSGFYLCLYSPTPISSPAGLLRSQNPHSRLCQFWGRTFIAQHCHVVDVVSSAQCDARNTSRIHTLHHFVEVSSESVPEGAKKLPMDMRFFLTQASDMKGVRRINT